MSSDLDSERHIIFVLATAIKTPEADVKWHVGGMSPICDGHIRARCTVTISAYLRCSINRTYHSHSLDVSTVPLRSLSTLSAVNFYPSFIRVPPSRCSQMDVPSSAFQVPTLYSKPGYLHCWHPMESLHTTHVLLKGRTRLSIFQIRPTPLAAPGMEE